MKIQVTRFIYCKLGISLSPYARYEAERMNDSRYLVQIDYNLFVLVSSSQIKIAA